MEKLQFWLTITMVFTAAAGTIWYIRVELETKGSLSTVGWSVIVAIWFVVIRRLIFQRRRKQ